MLNKIQDIEVASAAPFIPYLGIKIRPNIILSAAVDAILNKINFDLPMVEIRLVERLDKLKINPPIERILKEVVALR